MIVTEEPRNGTGTSEETEGHWKSAGDKTSGSITRGSSEWSEEWTEVERDQIGVARGL